MEKPESVENKAIRVHKIELTEQDRKKLTVGSEAWERCMKREIENRKADQDGGEQTG